MRRDALRLAALPLALAIGIANAAPLTELQATTLEPRAFGYRVGDTAIRVVALQVPADLALDETSLPRTDTRGRPIELRRIAQQRRGLAGSAVSIELTLTYQLFVAPPAVRTFELPGFTLRFGGRPRVEEARIEAWPVTLAPLVPVEVSPRRGLGELQPDAAAPPIDTTGPRIRLGAYAAAAALLAAYLLQVYVGLPWLGRSRRPFAQAWRQVRRLQHRGGPAGPAQRQVAFQRVHDALNRTAGEVLFAGGVAGFVATQPRFAPLEAELRAFFERSRAAFFAGGEAEPDDSRWLVDFCRRCRAAERGTA